MALFCVVLVLCSWCAVPFAVPFTLQLLGVFLAVGYLKTAKGTHCVTVYLCLGALGLPVFAGFQGGVGAFFGPTAGYLLGLLPLCLVSGWLYPKAKTLWGKGCAFALGLLVQYTLGVLWYALVYTKGEMSFFTALSLCVVPFLLPDLLKILVGVWLLQRLDGKQYERMV